MNRKHRIEMIVQVLLYPFICDPFNQTDPFVEEAKAYHAFYESDEHDRKVSRGRYELRRKELIQALEKITHPDRLSELAELVDMFFPSEELAAHVEGSKSERLEEYYFELLLRLSTEFITLRDGRVSIKMWDSANSGKEFFPHNSGLYKVELWSELSRTITPDVMIAGYFVQCGIQNVDYLQNLPDNIFLGDALLARLNSAGIAETHMHLSAGMSYQSVWEAVTDPAAIRVMPLKKLSIYQEQQREEQKRHRDLRIAGWLRLMIARYLLEFDENGHNCLIGPPQDFIEYFFQMKDIREDRELERAILRYIFDEEDIQFNETHLEDALEKRRESCLEILNLDYGVKRELGDLDVLARGPYQRFKRLNTSPELLLLFFALRHIRRYPEHIGFQRAFLCYLRIKNSYFSNKLQPVGINGLTFFRRYFANASSAIWQRNGEDREKLKIAYRSVFGNQMKCRDLIKMEVKISPPVSSTSASKVGIALTKQLEAIFETYADIIEHERDSGTVPTLGIVYHMLRGSTKSPVSSDCWRKNDQIYPGDSISRYRNECIQFVNELQLLRQQIPHLSEYVVGLDVASEEVYSEPWIFAPIYRQARNRKNTLPIQLDTGSIIQNIGFTYHVGEDYHHILSGLRHIDEVMTHFGYKAGDRLGHGLALQIDLREWVYHNEVVSLPILEHLENLLWIWSICNGEIKGMQSYQSALEREIMRLAEQLYTNIKGITPYLLWRAYQKKFELLSSELCEEMEMYLQTRDSGIMGQTSFPSQRSFCVFASDLYDCERCHMCVTDSVWDVKKLVMTFYCPVYQGIYSQPMFVSNGDDKLPLFRMAQEFVRDKVQNMGLFVEINPTSNMIIGDIGGFRDYPVTVLNNGNPSEKDPSRILISINSDDPLLFNTNVENELSLIYQILTYQNLSREDVLAWVDKVRQYGLTSSFIRKIKTVSEQTEELRVMCESLRSVREKIRRKGN